MLALVSLAMRMLSRFVLVGLVAAVPLGAACSESPVDRRISAAVVNGRPGFTPAVVRVEKGDKVELRVGDRTDKTHGFTIAGYGVARTVGAGKPITVKFTAKRAGRFRIFCQLHPAHQPAALVVS
jgi:nitrosocyanin